MGIALSIQLTLSRFYRFRLLLFSSALPTSPGGSPFKFTSGPSSPVSLGWVSWPSLCIAWPTTLPLSSFDTLSLKK